MTEVLPRLDTKEEDGVIKSVEMTQEDIVEETDPDDYAPTVPKPEGGTSHSGVSATVCANCGTTTTPLWRRSPNGETICNACGLYLKARNATRPVWLKRNSIKKQTTSSACSGTPGSCPGDGHCNGTGGSSSCNGCPAFNQHQVNRQDLVCANCRTTTTPLWRRDEAGNTICNACGLYYRLHAVHRPVTMKRAVIKRRKRVALSTSEHGDDVQYVDDHDDQLEHTSDDDDQHADQLPETDDEERLKLAKEQKSGTVQRKRKAIQGADGKGLKSKHPRPAPLKRKDSVRSVPAIEDYIEPRRSAYSVDGSTLPANRPELPRYGTDDGVNRQSSPRAEGVDRDRFILPPLGQPNAFTRSDGHSHHEHLDSQRDSVPRSLPPIHYREEEKQVLDRTPLVHRHSSHGIMSLLNPPQDNQARRSTPPRLPHLYSIAHDPHQSSEGEPTLLNRAHRPSTDVSSLSSLSSEQLVNEIHLALAAHKDHLQKEVANLSALLSRTAVVLSNIDQAMAATATLIDPKTHPIGTVGSKETHEALLRAATAVLDGRESSPRSDRSLDDRSQAALASIMALSKAAAAAPYVGSGGSAAMAIACAHRSEQGTSPQPHPRVVHTTQHPHTHYHHIHTFPHSHSTHPTHPPHPNARTHTHRHTSPRPLNV
ncbi:hypothetical protein BZG36_04343 [Bifiguratus adelaidae]|uniref:GATA-type domain-containing protein n=1 Tax=Bifiguratus adelaidae TaxID=1938954 RepID=A0A261XWT8_9FUNG|nr:hypothetical protein BZG36_04343 [Bifiguratus adelaidae]